MSSTALRQHEQFKVATVSPTTLVALDTRRAFASPPGWFRGTTASIQTASLGPRRQDGRVLSMHHISGNLETCLMDLHLTAFDLERHPKSDRHCTESGLKRPAFPCPAGRGDGVYTFVKAVKHLNRLSCCPYPVIHITDKSSRAKTSTSGLLQSSAEQRPLCRQYQLSARPPMHLVP